MPPALGRPSRLTVLLGLAFSAGATAVTLVLAARVAAQQRVEVLPSVGVSETFSDNLDFVPEGQRSGFTTNVTPRLRVGMVGGRLEGFAQYGANLRFEHFRGGESPGVDHDASARLDYAVSPRWQLFLSEDFRLSPDPTQDLAFVTPQGQTFRTFEEAARTPGVDVLDLRAILIREDQLRNRLALGTTYDLTPRWSAGADASWSVQDAMDNIFVEDSQTLAGRLRTDYRLTPVSDLRIAVGYEATTFDVGPDATVARFEGGWTRRLTESLRVDAMAGYAMVRTRDGEGTAGDPDENLAYGGASLGGDLARGRWRLRAAREVATGDGSGDVSRRDVVEASASRTLGVRVDLGGRLAYVRTRSVRDIGSESDNFEGTVSLSWRFIRWAQARLAYRYRYEDPLAVGGTIDENSGLIGVDVLWPVRELLAGPTP